jgi:hypothetical protein
MATTTNYGWTTPDDTALVKDGASAIRSLGTSVDTTTKNLNPSTTLGDIEYRSSTANTNTRLGIGTTGQVLSVVGGVPSWATPAAGGDFKFITRQTFSAQATCDIDTVFSSTYNTYLIVVETCFSSIDDMDLQIQFRYAGPTTETAGYYGRILSVQGTYTTVATSNAASGGLLHKIRTTAGQATNGAFYVNQVAGGAPMIHGTGHCGGTVTPNLSSNWQITSRNYTGFRLFASSGNLTADVCVYGLAKA